MLQINTRGGYFLIFLFLLSMECLIALFVHDRFIRPYVGDVLVVGVVYFFIKTLVPRPLPLLPLYVLIFAFFVELLQLFDLINLLGIENQAFRIILGSVFDWKDVACYAVGCILLAAVNYLVCPVTKPVTKSSP